MLQQRLFFKSFLIVYGSFLLVHVWEMGFGSWQLFAGMLGGVAIALVAHKQHGYAPSIFLVAHMVIEWYHHALHGSHYETGEIVFHGIHTCLDVMFLFIEARAHYGKYALPFVLLVGTTLGGIFIYYYIPLPHDVSPLLAQAMEIQRMTSDHHDHGGGMLHYVVIGGMFGCVFSHLFLAPRWKHVH